MALCLSSRTFKKHVVLTNVILHRLGGCACLFISSKGATPKLDILSEVDVVFMLHWAVTSLLLAVLYDEVCTLIFNFSKESKLCSVPFRNSFSNKERDICYAGESSKFSDKSTE